MKKTLWLGLLALCLAACGPNTLRPPARANMQIRDVRVVLPAGEAAGAGASLAGYLVIENTTSVDDRLIRIDADFADSSMLHQTVVDANGVASMKMIEALDLPAGGTVALSPGGYHLMFTGLKRELTIGDRIIITLTFEKSGVVVQGTSVTGP